MAAGWWDGTVQQSRFRDRLIVRAAGRRLVVLLYNGAGGVVWRMVESVGDLGETEVRLPSQQAVANLMESPPGCLELFHTSSPA